MLKRVFDTLLYFFANIGGVNKSADVFFGVQLAIIAVFVFALLILFVRKIKSLAFFGG